MVEPVHAFRGWRFSTWSRSRQGPLLRISSVLYNPITDSARALSYESPTDPTDGEILVSTRRSVYRIDRYWVSGKQMLYTVILCLCNLHTHIIPPT